MSPLKRNPSIRIGITIFSLLAIVVFISCASTPQRPPAVTEDHGRYLVTDCNSIVDTVTGLEWRIGPDQQMDAATANRWVRKLRQCSGYCCGNEWRFPTVSEEKTLFEWYNVKGVDQRRIQPQFEALIQGQLGSVWTSEAIKMSGGAMGVGIQGPAVFGTGREGVTGAIVGFKPGGDQGGLMMRPVAVRKFAVTK